MRLATQQAHDAGLPGSAALVARHAGVLRRFEDVAESFYAQGEVEDAIATAAAAAHFAALNHPGVLASPRLDDLLERISDEHVDGQPLRTPTVGRQRVLVIVTEAHAVGEHARLLWRWIARDPSRIYTVVATGQTGDAPDSVRAVIAAGGGELVEFPHDAPALARAAALRGMAAEADLIVLLDHPCDPLPTLAFAAMTDRPPIVMMNHGDHLLWLGRGIADLLMCTRAAGVSMAERRGFPSDRVISTPFPVSGPDDHGRLAVEPIDPQLRAQARTEVLATLAWPRAAVLIVTVGSDDKYTGPCGDDLLTLLEPVLLANPNAHLVAAGPRHDGRWQELNARTGGRVRALGEVPSGVGALHAAGDIYVESRPLGGPAAAAEAAAHGLPVIGGANSPLTRELFVTDPMYGALASTDADEYRALVTSLIADPERRAHVGDAARAAVSAADADWEPSVERAYALAAELGPIQRSELGPLPEPGEIDGLLDGAGPAGRRLHIDLLERTVWAYELVGRSPAVRALFGRLNPPEPRQERRYDVMFAAPGADAEDLRTVVSEFRTLREVGAAPRCVIALRPEDANVAVPVLEAAIAQGRDIDIDLVLDANPAAARPLGALDVVVDSSAAAEIDGGNPRDRHVCAAGRIAAAAVPA
jgi:glycosyltransferase involved in cell wall biosynthesis